MRKLTRVFLLCCMFIGFLLGFTGVLAMKWCNGISFSALFLFALLGEDNRGEWRFLSVEEARIRRSKQPRILHYLKRERPSEIPSAAWQALRNPCWPAYVTLVAPLPVIGFMILLTIRIKNVAGGPSAVAYPALGAAWFAVLFAFIVTRSVPAKRRRRFCERAKAGDYELCLECGYVLRGLPDIHQCPECGAEYDKLQVQAVWKDWCKDSGI